LRSLRSTRQQPLLDMIEIYGSTFAAELWLDNVAISLTIDAYSEEQARRLIRQQHPTGVIEDVFLIG